MYIRGFFASHKRELAIVVGTFAIAVCAGVMIFFAVRNSLNKNNLIILNPKSGTYAADSEDSVTVHVKGAVEKPGMYTLQGSPRVKDAINKAHALENADEQELNLAEFLEDGQEIYVPYKNTEKSSAGSGQSRKGTSWQGLYSER